MVSSEGCLLILCMYVSKNETRCIYRANSCKVCNLQISVHRPAFVNPLIPESPEEEEIFKQGESMSCADVVFTDMV